MPPKKQRELLEEIHKTVTILSVTLLGTPGTADEGLVGEYKKLNSNLNDLNHRHRRLSKTVWTLIGVLAGTGVIGTSLYNLLG